MNQQNVSTHTVSLKTMRQIDYTEENISTISIPPEDVPMLYGKQSYLRFNILLDGNCKGNVDESAAAASLIERVEIWTLDNQALIENIVDYNNLAATRNFYEDNDSMVGLNGIIEGYSPNDSLSSIYFDMPSSASQLGSTLFRQVEVCLPLRLSSVFYKKVFPVIAVSGIQLKIHFARNVKCLRAYTATGFNSATAFSNKVALAAGIAETQVVLNNTGAEAATLQNCPYVNDAANPPTIQYVDNSGNTQSGGSMTGMSVDASGCIVLASSGFTPAVAADAGNKVWLTVNYNMSYKVKNLELICNVVEPGKGYLDAMNKKLKSDGAITMDLYSWNNYKNNVNANETTTQQLVACQEARACSLVNNLYNPNFSFTQNDLKPIIDDMQNYQMNIHNQLIPNRVVDVSRFNTGINWNAIAVGETTKTLSRCFPVRKENENGKHFTFGREVSKEGYTSNLRDTDVRVNMFFKSPTVNKLLYSNVYHLRRLTITDNGINVNF